MFALQSAKVLNVTPPAAIVDNAAFTTATIDTKGFRSLTVYVSLGATDIAFTVLKLQESDDSGMSGAVDIAGTVFGGGGGQPALPTATDDNKVYAFYVDLRGRKRYIDVNLTIGDGTVGGFASILAILERAEESPDTAAERGVGAFVTV